MKRLALVSCLLAAFAVAEESMTLTFLGGKKKVVTIRSVDDAGLTIVSGGKEREVAWIELVPRSAYEARKAFTPYDQGAAKRALAGFARRLKLFPEALEQLEIALALDGISEGDFEKESREISEEEVAFLCHRIDLLLKTGEHPSVCLEAIKRLKERYPDHPNNAVHEPQVKALVEKLALEMEAGQVQEQKKIDDKELAKLRKAIARLNKTKHAALEKARTLRDQSTEAIAKRQVSRIKNTLVEPRGAERYYKRARAALRSMARTDKHFRIVTKAGIHKEYNEIEAELIQCYLPVARILLRGRNYKGARAYVAKILYYDPIHEEALDMKKTIQENRIHFRASDITNARPRVTGG